MLRGLLSANFGNVRQLASTPVVDRYLSPLSNDDMQIKMTSVGDGAPGAIRDQMSICKGPDG
jgi:hypothetical protein